ALVEYSALKNRKSAGEFSSDAVVAGDSASKADDVLSPRLSDDLPSVVATKTGEFIHGISTAAPKRLGESAADSSHEAADDLCSSEAGPKQLI
ncbi:hypothetical protein Tco_0208456, partial [Tanacetum coccineum]